MSVRVMSEVFRRYPVGGGEMLLALALADVARDDGVLMLNDSVPELARKTRQTDRGVQKQLGRMQAMGWLRKLRERESGRGRVVVYRISREWIEGAELTSADAVASAHHSAADGEPGSPIEPKKGEPRSPMPGPERVNGATQKGEPRSPLNKEPNTPNTGIQPQPLSKGLAPVADKPDRTGSALAANALVGFEAWLAACAERGEKPIAADDPVFAYCDRVGISTELLLLHWREFKVRRSESRKRQAGADGWRKTFRNSVRQNWYRLWFIRPGEVAQLTTVGQQAQLDAQAEHAAKAADAAARCDHPHDDEGSTHE